ncbi:MAG TPA: DUF6682 family protein [Roseateles sp.]|uniref:phage adaptor protein n=1 Tax=Roseateles sp. TaxID=1971397 RepID=UPI002ED8DF13
MTTLVRTFLRSVSTTLQDIAPQFSRWTEIELVNYANYGQMAIAKYLPQAGSRVDAIRLKPGTRQDISKVLAAHIVPGDGTVAVDTIGIALLDVVRYMGTNGSTPGRVVRLVESETLDALDPDWHTKAEAVVREYVFDKQLPKVFYVSPGVHAVTPVWVEISWLAAPRRIPAGGEPGAEAYRFGGGSNELLGIDDLFVEDLQNYVVAVALLKGSKNNVNLPKAQTHTGLFISSINAQASVLTGVNPNLKQLPFADVAGGA